MRFDRIRVERLLALISLLAYALPSCADDYYVGIDGSDDNPGTEQRPWRTIRGANENLGPGDTVFIKNGTYKDSIGPSRSGESEDSRIIYKAYPGHKPIVDLGVYLVGWELHSGKEGIDAIYKLAAKAFTNLAEDDFAANGRDTIYWNKSKTTKEVKNEVDEITNPAEFYHSQGYLYARTTDSRSPDKHRVRGLTGSGIIVNGKKYITVEGIEIRNVNHFVTANNASHIVLNNLTLRYAAGWPGISVGKGSHHWIVRNTIIEGVGSVNQHDGNAIMIEQDAHHVLIDDCDISYAGHAGIQTNDAPSELLIRGNVFHDSFGKPIEINGDSHGVVIENNVINDSPGPDQLQRQHARNHSSLELGGHRNIVRFNVFADNNGPIQISARTGATYGNSLYHNVVYGNQSSQFSSAGILFVKWHMTKPDPTDNVIVNNIFTDNFINGAQAHLGWLNTVDFGVSNNAVKNNLFSIGRDDRISINKRYSGGEFEAKFPQLASANVFGSPEFIGGRERPKLMQRSSALAVDKGVHLTRTTSAGVGVEVAVADARYFIDGFGLAQGDTVRIGGNEPVVIAKVNYDTHSITLREKISWNEGDGVSFPYRGSAPDIGTHEW